MLITLLIVSPLFYLMIAGLVWRLCSDYSKRNRCSAWTDDDLVRFLASIGWPIALPVVIGAYIPSGLCLLRKVCHPQDTTLNTQPMKPATLFPQIVDIDDKDKHKMHCVIKAPRPEFDTLHEI